MCFTGRTGKRLAVSVESERPTESIRGERDSIRGHSGACRRLGKRTTLTVSCKQTSLPLLLINLRLRVLAVLPSCFAGSFSGALAFLVARSPTTATASSSSSAPSSSSPGLGRFLRRGGASSATTSAHRRAVWCGHDHSSRLVARRLRVVTEIQRATRFFGRARSSGVVSLFSFQRSHRSF